MVQPSMHPAFSSNRMLLTGTSTNIIGPPFTNNPNPTFLGSNNTRFPKVLQGQEICSLRSLTGKPNGGSWGPPNTPGFYPLGSEGGRNFCFPNSPPVIPATGFLFPTNRGVFGNGDPNGNGLQLQLQLPGKTTVEPNPVVEGNSGSEKDDGGSDSNGSSCKLFGFQLNGAPTTVDAQSLSKRSCTKVRFVTYT